MIIFFTKAPELGYGKSRLALYMDEEKVLKLSRKLIKDAFEVIKEENFVIYYAGKYENLGFLSQNLDNIAHRLQTGENLGEAMKTAIFQELEENEKVILIGSDLVGLDKDLIDSIYKALDSNDIVITPALDGGYGLIGMRKPCDVFTGVQYSRSDVLEMTLALAERKNFSVKVVGRVLDIDNFEDLVRAETGCEEIKEIGRGEYNLNYLVRDRVFRINFASQMGLGAKQIEYEFKALKQLEKTGVTPRVFNFSSSGKYLPYGYLTMEYLEGLPLNYDTDLRTAAKILAKIHNLDTENFELIRAYEPFKMMYQEFLDMYIFYKEWRDRDRNVESVIDELLSIARHFELDTRMVRPSIINTELNNRNFIIGKRAYVIDWEKPLIGDCEQDLAHFLVPTTTNWKTDKILSENEIDEFLLEYEKYRKIDHQLLRKYMVFNSLRGITWCSMAKVDYSKDRSIKNKDTLEKIDIFLSLDFLKMIKERFFR